MRCESFFLCSSFLCALTFFLPVPSHKFGIPSVAHHTSSSPHPTPRSESLLRLPPSLETLLSEKRFLSAVVLLVRCNKALRKPELLEVGALSDLRAWAIAQEGVRLLVRLSLLSLSLPPPPLSLSSCANPPSALPDSRRLSFQQFISFFLY